MKSVLMLYPIERFVEEDRRVFARPQRNYWDKVFGEGSYDKRARLINRLLDQYRSDEFQVAWGLFSSEGNRSLPDESRLSKIFELKPEDLKVALGITSDEMFRPYVAPVTSEDTPGRSRYPDEAEVLRRMGTPEELVVGGFHADDCVDRFVQAGKKLGIKSSTDYLLTEDFFFNVYWSFKCDMDQRMIDSGHLDAEMHEDNPLDEKRLTFDNRLNQWLN